jgi:phospholipid-binding lipoprotein MlaA
MGKIIIVGMAWVTLLISGVTVAEEDMDPWLDFNRSVFEFNETLDAYVAKPVAQGYQAVTPQFVDTGISNFFSNLEDVLIIVNDVFQLKPLQALSDSGRFIVNSTIGLLGFFDVASHIGLVKHNEDLGQTLGYWGVGSGPYVMLPVLGPSSLRDAFGTAADTFSGLGYTQLGNTTAQQGGLWLLRNIDVRADLIASEDLITGERYAFFRSFYTQRRQYLVSDGEMPDDDFDEDEGFDEDEDLEDLY